MEEDIQNFSPSVMFRGTPCTSKLRNDRTFDIKKNVIDSFKSDKMKSYKYC